eukprot:2053707-Rhodomonas_salina.2
MLVGQSLDGEGTGTRGTVSQRTNTQRRTRRDRPRDPGARPRPERTRLAGTQSSRPAACIRTASPAVLWVRLQFTAAHIQDLARRLGRCGCVNPRSERLSSSCS